jgi:DNA-binding LytR/AlgR family response regulator
MKAVILEDEEIIAKVLEGKIRRLDPSIEIVEILPSLKVAKKWFLQHAAPDLLFMDIQLSDGVSFELLEQYQLDCPIIFTTAFDEYAIRAFKVNGIDYLLKPIDDTELTNAIQKAKQVSQFKKDSSYRIQDLLQAMANPGHSSQQYKERFLVNIRNQWMPVQTRDVAVITRDNLNFIYLFSGERYIIDYTTLDDVEEVLDPRQFYRANRQFIININAVQTVKPIENSKLTIRLKEPNHKFEIDMSREKAPLFKKWLDR